MPRTVLAALILLVISPACSYGPHPVAFPERPGFGRGAAPSPGNPPKPQPAQCAEVARTRCDAVRCGGFKFDYVSVQCTGEGLRSYCQANSGCKVEDAGER